MKKIGVLMGSDSDLEIVEKGIEILKEFNVDFEVHVYSAHRLPDETLAFAKNARKNNIGVIICHAGLSAHLAGFVASSTSVPVIGVPISSKCLDGLDALLSTVNMPSGVTVACVGINNSKNASLLAIEMLSINDDELYNKLVEYRKKNSNSVLEKNEKIEKRFNIKKGE